MKSMSILICQDCIPDNSPSVNVVIDVIRAFSSVVHAFESGVEKIQLIENTEAGLRFKSHNNNAIIAGELSGSRLPGYDLDNSPYQIRAQDLRGKMLGLKTTNGVRVLLNSLNAEHVFAVGANNAIRTALYIHHIISKVENPSPVNLIASHPTAEEDLSCAVFMKNIILSGEFPRDQEIQDFSSSVLNASAAKKFLDRERKEFNPMDLVLCSDVREGAVIFVDGYGFEKKPFLFNKV